MSPAPSELADLFHSVAGGLRRSWMEDIAPFRISPHQWRALHTIIRHGDEPPRQRDVALALKIAPRSAAEVIRQLEEAGWVTRSPDPRDKRAVLLLPTDAGRELDARVHAIRAERSAGYFAVLPDNDRHELARLLTTLLEANPRPAGHSGPGSHRLPR